MERAISQEERIRRAEEIYSRRKSQNSRREEYATLNVGEKREYGLFKRMTIQIIACLMIYSAFYGIQNSKDIFSEQIINKANKCNNRGKDRIYNRSKQKNRSISYL